MLSAPLWSSSPVADSEHACPSAASLLYAGLTFSLASLAFSFGSWTAQRSHRAAARRQRRARDGAERRHGARHPADPRRPRRRPRRRAPTASGSRKSLRRAATSQPALVDEIKRQLQSEMGLMPVRLLRERRESFVELNAYDNFGKSELRHGRLPGQRLLRHREARASSRSTNRRTARQRKITVDQDPLQGQGPAGAARRHRRCQRRSALRRLGDHPCTQPARSAGAARRHELTATTSPIRSSASATTTRRASSSAPATSASARRTAS